MRDDSGINVNQVGSNPAAVSQQQAYRQRLVQQNGVAADPNGNRVVGIASLQGVEVLRQANDAAMNQAAHNQFRQSQQAAS